MSILWVAEGGRFMVSGSLRGCQRLRWGIWYVRRLGDCWLEFGVYVESFNCVHVGSFVILQHLHNIVYGAERMCFLI